MPINSFKAKTAGFSLVELSVVIVLMGILMTFGIRLASSFQNKGALSATHTRQQQILEALRGHLAQTGRLPCPAAPKVGGNPPTGDEDPTPSNGTCATNPGLIPFKTLGLPRDTAMDGWERYFTYTVWDNNAPLTDPARCAADATVPSLAGVTGNQIQNWTLAQVIPATTIKTYHEDGNGCLIVRESDQNGNLIARRRTVALIISHGPNGYGGYSIKGDKLQEGGADGSPEALNVAGHAEAVANTFNVQPSNLSGFDDIVLEVSNSDLVAPLKRDGSIKSVNEAIRNLIDSHQVNLSNCKVTVPAGVSHTLPASDPELSCMGFSQTLHAVNYGCSTLSLGP